MAHFQFVDDINQKYLKEEVDLEDKLKAVREKYASSDNKESLKRANNKIESQSRKAARRNKALLKDLELAAGKLRVQSCYSPTEALLEKTKQRYFETLEQLAQSRACSSDRNSQVQPHAVPQTSSSVMIRIRETAPPLDYSFKSLEKIDELHLQRPRRGVKRYRRTSSGRYSCTSLRLNNNHLTTVHGIHAVAYQVLEQPEKLTWLDLSFNKLTTVAPEIASFASLKILYLHGNQLSDLAASVRPLKCLDDLYSLTLHGNPLEERKGYRAKVLTALPQLRSLDFTNVTAAELKQIEIRKSASAAAENYQLQNRVKSTF